MKLREYLAIKAIALCFIGIALVALIGAVVGIIIFGKAAFIFFDGTDVNGLFKIIASLTAFAASVIVLHISMSRSIVGLLMRTKKFKNRGTNIFTLRQLSSKLSANSILIGLLAFLISFATTYLLSKRTVIPA